MSNAMSISQTTLHIVYVHGFQGDHTTFQSFPTDLHKKVLPQIPSHINLRSMLYPTYKSKRPIVEATQNLLNWLDTLPYGPVILCGHSMGGLLVADAATSRTHSAARRVIAVLAFDVPFLGMHPHVVISGIASLLPNKTGDSNERGSEHGTEAGGGLRSEREMNDQRHVHVPADEGSASACWVPQTSAQRLIFGPATSPNASKTTFSDTGKSSSNLTVNPPPLPPRPSSNTSTQPHSSSSSHISNSNSSPTSHSPSPGTPKIVHRTLALIDAHANDPLFRFIKKHRDDPLGAMKRWVVERFEFGSCMFDPKGLKQRYAALQAWRRPWVAYWTETMPGATQGVEGRAGDDTVGTPMEADVDVDAHPDALRAEEDATGSLRRLLAPTLDDNIHDHTHIPPASPSPSSSRPASPSPHASFTKSDDKMSKDAVKQHEKDTKAAQKQQEKDLKTIQKQQEKELKALHKQQKHDRSPHHFVVRPFSPPSSSVHRWEEVKVRGAKDEVEAHCGLFLRNMNWEYEAFVGRVATVVLEWVGAYDGYILELPCEMCWIGLNTECDEMLTRVRNNVRHEDRTV